MESDDQQTELHQIHAIATPQDLSMEQISFIANETLNDTTIFEDEDLPAWDGVTTEDELNTTLNLDGKDTQDEHHSDLGDLPPGSDT
jgi:hypothetical protein